VEELGPKVATILVRFISREHTAVDFWSPVAVRMRGG